jgi:hypothetical protein
MLSINEIIVRIITTIIIIIIIIIIITMNLWQGLNLKESELENVSFTIHCEGHSKATSRTDATYPYSITITTPH